MKAHNFYESRKTETKHFAAADIFYTEQMDATKIVRCDYSTKEGRNFQKADIDLWLNLKTGKVSVSEKKRTRDYNDLYLEVYSKFPDTPGWTTLSKADFLAYFFPKRVFWAGFPQIIRFYNEQLAPRFPQELFKKLRHHNREKNTIEKITVNVAGLSCPVSLIQAYNECDGNSWYTMGISIPFDMLTNNHIKYRIYELKEIT
ncbi:MAG TPA: hypothetical protein ENG85_00660 [Bacteroidetes bacterium]|nr:hypothetical protein [Bacteroidota bacterium]